MPSFKQLLKVVIFVGIIIIVNVIMSFLLNPVTYTRVDMHRLRTESYEDIFVGTSHGFSGVSPEKVSQVTGRKTMNMCIPGQFPQDAYYIVREAERTNEIKRVVYELDMSYLSAPYDIKNSPPVYQELPFSKVKLECWKEQVMPSDFRMTLFPWYLQCDEYRKILQNVKAKTSAEYKSYSAKAVPNDSMGQFYKGDGFLYLEKPDVENVDKGDLKFNLWNQQNEEKSNFEYLEKTIQFCRNKGIEFNLVVLPVPEETYRYYNKNYAQEDEYCKVFAAKWKIKYVNFNVLTPAGFNKSLDGYADYDGHMYGKQAEQFSEILGEYLNEK